MLLLKLEQLETTALPLPLVSKAVFNALDRIFSFCFTYWYSIPQAAWWLQHPFFLSLFWSCELCLSLPVAFLLYLFILAPGFHWNPIQTEHCAVLRLGCWCKISPQTLIADYFPPFQYLLWPGYPTFWLASGFGSACLYKHLPCFCSSLSAVCPCYMYLLLLECGLSAYAQSPLERCWPLENQQFSCHLSLNCTEACQGLALLEQTKHFLRVPRGSYFCYNKNILLLQQRNIQAVVYDSRVLNTRLSPFLCHSKNFLILETLLEFRVLASLLLCFSSWSLKQNFSGFTSAAISLSAFPYITSNVIYKLQSI